MDRLSLQQLDFLVKSAIWRGDAMMTAEIFSNYVRLVQQTPFPNFGTADYWDEVLGPDDDDDGAIDGGAIGGEALLGGGPLLDGGAIGGGPLLGGGGPLLDGGAIGGGPLLGGGGPLLDGGAIGGGAVGGGPLLGGGAIGGVVGGGAIGGGAVGGSALPGGGAIGGAYRLSQMAEMNVKKFRTTGQFFRLHLLSDDAPLETMRQALTEAIEHGFTGHQDALVGIEIQHRNLDRPIIIPFSDRQKMTANNALNVIEAVLQSAQTVQMGSSMEIKVVRIENPKATGRQKGVRLLGELAPSVARMVNDDDLCVARSLVYAVARHEQHIDDEARRRWHRVLQGDKNRHTTQRRMAQELMRRADIPEGTRCGVAELTKMQAVLTDYQIKAWDIHLCLFFEGSVKEKKIYLLFNDGHCQPIKSIIAFMGRSYFCDSCNVGYDHKENHKCKDQCKYCLVSGGDCATDQWKKCDDCGRRFPRTECFDRHKAVTGRQQKSTCEKLRVCNVCGSRMRMNERHHCGEQLCPSCKQYDVALDHQYRCYMQPIDKEGDDDDEPGTSKRRKVEKKIKSFIFFDFESRQDEQYAEDAVRHRVNYCVVQKVCDKCKDTWSPESECEDCEDRQLVFEGDDCTEQFAAWLLTPRHQNCIAFAHNFSGYDGQFILEHAVKKGIKPDIIPRGLSIMSMSMEGIRFLDSYSFLPMALSALPKAFGFDRDVLKGYFPHLFNTAENQDYIGPFPDTNYYMPDTMKPESREKFLKWHAEQEGKEFNFREEMRRYCTDDVNILRRAVLDFRRIFMENTTVDPYLESVTIASACSLVFRKLFLDEETIGIVPHEGYRRNDKQSVVVIQWLKWLSHTRQIDIQHARNTGEVMIGPYKADGFCVAENKIYEFHGCLFHGCPCIKTRDRKVPGSNVTMDDAYSRTRDRRDYFISRGYDYEEVWNCEYDRMLADDREMHDFIDTLDLVLPLDPRGAFFGGRTNAIVLQKTVEEGERIEYADFVSLYPTVLKQHPFPLGHPKIITENFKPITADSNPYFGLVKCDIVAPRGLYHPVLPMRCGGKLQFPLCRTCAIRSEENCAHSDDERMLKGEWVTVEIDKALQLGYKIIKVYEVWHYRHQSDPTNSDTFFGAYVNCFLKLKAESSGFPARVTTDEEKDAFVQDFAEKEGVHLDKAAIKKNPGLRLISKLCLNSFWGKFGQRNNLPSVAYFTTSKEYFKLINDPANDIISVQFAGQDVICVNYRRREVYVDALANTNPVIAAFTTAWARLKLYGCLERLQRRVLYMDTDSVIYTVRDGEWRPPMGEKLGEMTDELAKDYGEGAYCDRFVGAGPKNYALSVVNGDARYTIVKVRGFTLNWSASRKINFDTMLELMMKFLDGDADHITIDYPQITRTLDRVVLTKKAKKDYKIVYTKRSIVEDGSTLPWGY